MTYYEILIEAGIPKEELDIVLFEYDFNLKETGEHHNLFKEINKDEIDNFSFILLEAFTWGFSPQGHQFWRDWQNFLRNKERNY